MAGITTYTMGNLFETYGSNVPRSIGNFMISDYAQDITNYLAIVYTIPGLVTAGLRGITVLDDKPVTVRIASTTDLNNFVKITNSAGTASPVGVAVDSDLWQFVALQLK